MTSGDSKKKGGGRKPRPKPRAGVAADADWLAEPLDDVIQETARQFAINLSAAIHHRLGGGISGRKAAEHLGVDHNSLRRILSGDAYPDLVFIITAELALNKRLWPRRPR